MRVMIKKYLIFFSAIMLWGCAIQHAEEIRRLQKLARESVAQSRDVRRSNEHFKALLEVVVQDQMHKYNHQKDFLDHFGPPVFTKEVKGQDKAQELWLYRYYEQMWGSEKVYLYFDQAGFLVQWEHRDSLGQ